MPNLKTCSDCTHEVSASAVTCPKCGKNFGSIPVWAGIGIVFAVISGLIWALSQPTPMEQKFNAAADAAQFRACEAAKTAGQTGTDCPD